jgi:hypothetical protein
MHARSAALIVALLALTGGIAACGSSSSSTSSGNGIASKSPTEIVNEATTAVNGVQSLHVSGSVSSQGSPITLDLDLVSGKGGRGNMSESGLGFQLVALNNTAYLNGTPAFWRHFGGTAAEQLFKGKWLKAPMTGSFASLAELTDIHRLVQGLLSNHGTLTKGAETTINGHKVIPITDSTRGGTLYVATEGKPYPIELSKSGSDGGRIDFDRFNESVPLSAPANAIDISKLSSQ